MVLKNENVLKRRILGLSSYFKSAEEGLLPSFVMNDDKIFHIVACEMSDYQFGLYEKIRKEEADKEKNARRRKKVKLMNYIKSHSVIVFFTCLL